MPSKKEVESYLCIFRTPWEMDPDKSFHRPVITWTRPWRRFFLKTEVFTCVKCSLEWTISSDECRDSWLRSKRTSRSAHRQRARLLRGDPEQADEV